MGLIFSLGVCTFEKHTTLLDFFDIGNNTGLSFLVRNWIFRITGLFSQILFAVYSPVNIKFLVQFGDLICIKP